MAKELKSTATVAIKLLLVLAILTILQKTCICNRQLFSTKKNNFIVVTSLDCITLDPNYIKMTKCILKAVNRTHKFIIARGEMLKIWKKPITIHFRVMKRTNGGFKPFGIDVTLDGCGYTDGKKNLAFDWFYEIIFPFSSFNHSCPFEGEWFFNVPVNQLQYPSVFPEGEYRFDVEFGTVGKIRSRAYADLTLKEI